MDKDVFPYPVKRIGIIGGGQLAKMSAQAAKQMGFYLTILDPTPKCPAAYIADAQIVGDLYDSQKLMQLAKVSDVLSYDIEHIDVQILKTLEKNGHHIYPLPSTLEIIQDKLKQKQVLAAHQIPVPNFTTVEQNNLEQHFPIVQKARKGGYDGKGVVVLKSIADKINLLQVPSMFEDFIEFKKELAIIIARDITGKIATYPVVEMIFDDKTNICDIVAAPARIDNKITIQARQIAIRAVEVLNGIGVFGVEMFLTQDDQILVNEIAPRPHNSGHYTIEACVTSQFEQLIRIISGLPLGKTDLLKPAAMWNLLGENGYTGSPIIEGLQTALAIPGLSFHLYDKAEVKPFRKMGHITILAENVDEAIEQIKCVENTLKIKGTKTI